MITLCGGKYNLKDLAKKFSKLVNEKLIKTELFSDTVFETVPFKSIYISGCKKIKEYGKETIVLECTACLATVKGSGLYVENLINGQICVMGRVESVEFR